MLCSFFANATRSSALSFLNAGHVYRVDDAAVWPLVTDLAELGLVHVDAARFPQCYIPTPFIAHLSSGAAAGPSSSSPSSTTTPSSSSLSSSSSSSPAGMSNEAAGGALVSTAELLQSGFIIVETTFTVYAYTSSPLHHALLRTFLVVQRILPNLFIGKLTKESVRVALTRGITASEIVGFLNHYAHARMRDSVPPLPGNVTKVSTGWKTIIRQRQ
jgi:hypothetical protein